MRGAGVSRIGGPVTVLDLPGPTRPGTGEVLLDVQASGAGNWDGFVRTGGWDTGLRPPMALGVEAAGRVAAVGDDVAGIAVGDAVTTHSLPLRGQGSWAQQHLAAAADVALIPPGAPDAMRATRDGGRLATIAGDPPAPRRGIAVTPVVVAPDGARLRLLAGWLAEGTISITVGGRYPLEQAGEALAQARRGLHGAAMVLRPAGRPGSQMTEGPARPWSSGPPAGPAVR